MFGLGPIWTILNNQSYLPSFEYHVIGNKLPDPSRDGFQCPSMENVGWCFTGPITLQGYTGIMSVYMNTHPPVMTWFPISYVVVRCEITKQRKHQNNPSLCYLHLTSGEMDLGLRNSFCSARSASQSANDQHRTQTGCKHSPSSNWEYTSKLQSKFRSFTSNPKTKMGKKHLQLNKLIILDLLKEPPQKKTHIYSL